MVLSPGLKVETRRDCPSAGVFWYGNWTVPGWFGGTHYYIYLGGGEYYNLY
jgi:hypothetical protein